MAESADPSKLTERYAAIEQAYCADQWGAVIDQGQDLLGEIPRTSGPVPEGLKERVQLLMAHAHLYGFNEGDVAEDLYSAVLHSKAEVALRQIAEQGLQQCNEPRQQLSMGVSEANADTEPSPEPGAEVASSAASATAGEQPAAEVLPALTSEPEAAALDRATTGAEPGSSGLKPAVTAPATGADSAATSSLAMPWLTATSSEPSSAATPWATAATPKRSAATKPSLETPAEPQELLPAQPPASTAEALIAAPAPGALEATLIPEVVEEPELFEVHQADPRLAEELELTVLEAQASDGGSASPRAAALAGPAAAIVMVETQARQEQQTTQRTLEASESVLWQKPLTALGEAQSQLSLAKGPDELSDEMEPVCELFRNPPAPVEEEDQDLLLGLLRVLVSADSAGDSG